MSSMIYLKEVPFIKKFFGFVLSLLGLGMFFLGTIFMGLIFIVIGLNLILTEGSEINLSNKTYRELKSIFGIHFGKWKPCPEFEYVSIFKTTESQTINVVSATTTLQSQVILLNVFYNRNKHLTFYKTDNKVDALKVANHFKLALDIDILDATESEKKWL
ncbi:hypothetical protein [Flavobacterium sp.]|uniref:hypothetical protein n=1 Tax=Flavobacterium sp. TaxID=239 RepID=UPI0026061CB3|nr:hypothetical protein [Flavobacterium sp.]